MRPDDLHGIDTLCLVALPAEAKPLRQLFDLQPLMPPTFARAYVNDWCLLLVTGVGEENAYHSTRQALGLFTGKWPECIVNIGIAGHRDIDTGTACQVDRVLDSSRQSRWHLSVLQDGLVETRPVVTVAAPQLTFSDDYLYDMELAGISRAMQASGVGSTLKCVKIVSDNQRQPARQVNNARINTWILDNHKVLELLMSH